MPSGRTGSAEFFSRSHRAVIRVYDEVGNVIETLLGNQLIARGWELKSPTSEASFWWRKISANWLVVNEVERFSFNQRNENKKYRNSIHTKFA